MKHYIAKMLRRAANQLDPQPEPWVALVPNYTTSATNVNPVFQWRQMGSG